MGTGPFSCGFFEKGPVPISPGRGGRFRFQETVSVQFPSPFL
jgi:hypothetical protein